MSKFPLRLFAINSAKSPRSWKTASFEYSKNKTYTLTSINCYPKWKWDQFTGKICMNYDKKWYMIIKHCNYNKPVVLSYKYDNTIDAISELPIGYYDKEIEVKEF